MINLLPIPLCSSCIHHEISSWINERVNELNTDAKLKINEELKSIRLKKGECIICKKQQISSDLLFNILKILKETKIKKPIINEFKKMFGYKINDKINRL